MPFDVKGPGSLIPAIEQEISTSTSSSPSASTAPSPDAIARLMATGQAALAQARSLTVTNPESLQLAADARSQLKRGMDLVEGLLRRNIRRLDKAHKDAVQEMKQILSPFEQADLYLKSQQDQYQLREKQKKEEERRRLEAAMAAERRRMLEEEMAQALQQQQPDLTTVIAKAAEPLPSLPIVNRSVKAEGAVVRWLPKFRLLNLGKVSPQFILGTIRREVEEKGECEWLMKAIKREVERVGKNAEVTVGAGSIEYYEEPSTGARR